MQLVKEFTVPGAADSAFATLSDVERIAPCMPGAVLDEVRGDEYRGRVRVRIGPVGLSFAGTATVLERDPTARRLVVRGAAKDKGGQGGAEALITMTVQADAGSAGGNPSSTVRVVTDLGLSGKVGQFGGPAINQVSDRIIRQFVERVDELVRGEDGAVAATPTPLDGTWNRRFPDLATGSRAIRQAAPGVLATIAAGVLLGAAIARALRSAGVRQDGLDLDG
jgi:uncharacterized protein